MPLTMMTRAWPLLLGMGVLMLGAGLQGTLLGIRSIAVTYGAQSETALRTAAPTWVAHSFPEVVRIALRLATLEEP